MKNKYYLSIALITLLSLFSGCKKEGPAGPAGKEGNANVKSSTTTFSNWTWDGSSGVEYDYVDFTWGEITSEIVNTGGVFIYVSNGAGGWLPLPRTIFPNNAYTQSQRFVYTTGAFRIIVQDSDLTQPLNPGTWTIKVLAVASSLRQANPDLDWNNYEAVKEALQLED